MSTELEGSPNCKRWIFFYRLEDIRWFKSVRILGLQDNTQKKYQKTSETSKCVKRTGSPKGCVWCALGSKRIQCTRERQRRERENFGTMKNEKCGKSPKFCPIFHSSIHQPNKNLPPVSTPKILKIALPLIDDFEWRDFPSKGRSSI